MDGITLIPLGRCVNKTININGYLQDPTIEFEMDNPLPQTVYYDQKKVNIFFDENE